MFRKRKREGGTGRSGDQSDGRCRCSGCVAGDRARPTSSGVGPSPDNAHLGVVGPGSCQLQPSRAELDLAYQVRPRPRRVVTGLYVVHDRPVRLALPASGVRHVVLPPPAPLQTRMCGAASMSTAMARPSVPMPISVAKAGSASICSRRPGSVRRSSFGSAVVVVMVRVTFLCCAWGTGCSPGLEDRVGRTGQVPVRGRHAGRAGPPGRFSLPLTSVRPADSGTDPSPCTSVSGRAANVAPCTTATTTQAATCSSKDAVSSPPDGRRR